MKKLAVLGVALAMAAGASANTYYSVKGSNGALSKILKWHDAATGEETSATPAANDGHIWVLAGAATLNFANTDTTLPDTTWYWGSDGQTLPIDACIYSQWFGTGSTTTTNETRHFTVPHCTVFGCEIVNNMGSGTSTLYLSGDYTFKHVDGQDISFKCNGSSQNVRPIVLDENFKATSGQDVTLQFSSRVQVMDAYGVWTSLRGDFGDFKGGYDVSVYTYNGLGTLKLESPTAMGDPTSAKTDAVTLHKQTKLAIGPSVVQSATRGITLSLAAGEKAYIGTIGGTASDAVTVTAPIYGSTGTLVKNDLGTVTLAGSVEATNIEVAGGTLVLGEMGLFPAGLAVTVKSGAKLVQRKHVKGLTVVCEDGGVWEKDIQQVVIYDASSDACEPLDFEDRDPESPLLRLSAMMNLPFSAEKALDVMKLPMTTKMKAEDFVDATEKTFGLPQTWFELEERDDCQMLVLHARPVVVSVRAFADADGGLNAPSADAADFPWSDGPGMFEDRDYLLQHTLNRFGSASFEGHSLTVAPPTADELECRLRYVKTDAGEAEESRMDKAFVYPGTTFRGNSAELKTSRVYGDLTLMGELCGESGTTFLTRQAGNGNVMRMDVRAALKGVGTARLALHQSGVYEVELSGGNDNFQGCLMAVGHESCREGKEMRLHFGKANQLGGAMEAFVFNALELRNYTLLRPRHSVTLEAANRGIYVNGNGGFLVDMDVTNTTQPVELTVNEPIRVNGTLYKQGAGTLTLGSAVTFGADGAGTSANFVVRAGTVKLLPEAQVAGLNCTFADGTELSVDPTMNQGFRGSFAVEGSLRVSLAAQPKGKGVSFRIPICTVPVGSADLTNCFVAGTERAGWRFGRIVRETDAQGDHYFVEYVTRALRCVVR